MKRILGILLAVIGILLFLFFRNYQGSFIPYPILWYIVGLIFILVGIRLFITSKTRAEKNVEKSFNEEVSRLKQEGRNIVIKLADCDIVSTKSYKEMPKSESFEIQAWDTIYSGIAVDQVEVNQSRIIYDNRSADNECLFVSPIINKDKATLSFALGSQETTNVFVDKDDSSIYYFDLDFLLE